MRRTFAQDKPLSLSASLCFEQSYSGVDGDSASSTEIYALLSALSDIPIRQELAVTGSVNQQGDVQPIGGVNEKIEGFYDVCRLKGLNGKQGVLIPAENVDDLMLQEEVIEAVARGDFHIYPVSTIEQGIEILTGVHAGKNGETGRFEAESVFARANTRLTEMAATLRDFE
jgi:predicted ATP-dependent protease